MKFTYSQKKWAMTGVLLAVLGFNVSMNKHSDGIASADFASESGDLVESKIVTADGVFNVKYIKSGDNEVMAVIPKVTEGKTCDVCGTTYTLDASLEKNKSNIDELNMQLLKQIKATEKSAPAKLQTSSESDEKSSDIEYMDRVDKIEDQCSGISDADRQAQCLTTKLVRLIPNKTASESSKILKLINKKIIPAIGSKLTDLRTEAYESGDAQNLKADSRDAVQPLKDLAEAAKKDKNFTKSFMGLQANLLVSEFRKIKELENTAIAKAGTMEGQSAGSQAIQRKLGTTQLVNQLVDAQILPSIQNLQEQFYMAQDFEEKKMIKETIDRSNEYTQLLEQNMKEISDRYLQNAQPAPGTAQSGNTATGVRGSGTRDGIQVTPGGTTALPAPASIRSSGAPGPIAAPMQGAPTAPVGMTGYQLQSQPTQDALAPRVQLAPRGY